LQHGLGVRHFLTAKVYFTDTVVGLDFLNRPLANHGTFVEHRDRSCDLPNEFHIVLDHDHCRSRCGKKYGNGGTQKGVAGNPQAAVESAESAGKMKKSNLNSAKEAT
jgi:hypothetical protein